MKKIIILIALMTLMFSCHKQQQLPTLVPTEYEGVWDAKEKTIGGINVYYTIVIGSNGIGSYKKDGFIEDEQVEGEVYISADTLKIKTTKFIINQKPKPIEEGSPVWIMIINDIEYRKN